MQNYFHCRGVNGGMKFLTQDGIKITTLMNIFTYYGDTMMIREEEYLMIRDLRIVQNKLYNSILPLTETMYLRFFGRW